MNTNHTPGTWVAKDENGKYNIKFFKEFIMIELKILDNLKKNTYFETSDELKKYATHGPEYAKQGDAGIDLRACIYEPIYLQPNQTVIIDTGIAMHINTLDINEFAMYFNSAGLIMPRSGLGIKHGIVLSNLTGVIDSGYQDEIKIGAWNRSEITYIIHPGVRLCQMLFMPVFSPQFKIVDEFSNSSERGLGGLGSTGVA